MALQALVLPLVSVFRSAGFNEAMKAIKGLDGSFKDVAKSAGFAAANFAAAGVLQGVTRYIDEAVVATGKFERNLLALNQVFEANFGQMQQFTAEAQKMGIGQGQAAQASVFLGSVLKQYGVSAADTVTETQKLVGLAQDLATTFGYDLSEALVATTALFRGEYDPIEKFGVAMKQSEINALLAARGQSDLTGELLLQAQVRARLDLLYERSADAMGAFERASGTLYVAQQKLNASLENQQIAFGQGLQGPLATITDLFAEITERMTPFADFMGLALGGVLELLGETLVKIAEASFSIIDYIGSVITSIQDLVNATNDALSLVETDAKPENPREREIRQLEERIITLQANIKKGELGWQQYENELVKAQNELAVLKDATYDADTELKRFQNQAERTKVVLEETLPSLTTYGLELQNLGLYSVDAEGKLTGLAGLFLEIEEAAQKSSASEVLMEIGFNAGQIETILSRPDWAQIFGQISRLAKIAALDIANIGGSAAYAAGVAQGAANKTLQELLDEIKGEADTGGSAPKKPRDAVKALFNEMREEVNKQAASLKLAAMGASQGLIDLILGDADWAKLWNQIKTGVISLKDLQKQFNSTAAGVRELEDALQAARDEADAFIKDQQAKKDKLEQVWIDAKARAEDFKKTIAEIAGIEILPTIAEEVGQFEQQIVGFIDNIQNALKQGFESKAIFEADYLALKAYADQEAKLLQSIARQRDDLANRYKLSEALIKEYESAFKSAANLTALFSKLKGETEKRTVTEITKSVAQLSGSLKQFNVTVTREYEETIDKVANKTEGLLTGFRDMATKARSFAENLRKLKDMNLNGDLFNQLVQAGVEAGGETAQALVDGGSDTIKEINNLFDEISVMGANLGLEAATELYGSGIDMVDGLMDGIRSKQTELEALAQSMADAFNAKFQARISVAADKPVAAAEADFNKIVVPKLDDIDVAGLAQLNAYLENAGAALNVVKGVGTRAGIESKIDIVEMLKKDVLAGAKLDLSGITSGLTSSELMAAAQATGSSTVNNYYTTISPGDRLQQNTTLETLQTFANQNGNIGAWVAL